MMDEKKEEEELFCTKCGKEIAENVNYCPYCGHHTFLESTSNYSDETFSFEAEADLEQNTESFLDKSKENAPEKGTSDIKYAGFPMKWYKFLIYFSLWVGALLNLAEGIMYISGYKASDGIFEYELYPYLSGLQTLDFLFGILCIAFAFYAINVRFKLARLKRGAPHLLILYWIFSFFASVLYGVIYLIICSQRINITSEIASFTGTIIGRGIAILVFILLNRSYFKRRESLFVN